MANYASCDADHIRHLLNMVVTGLRRLRGQHPWLLRGLDEQYSWLDGIQDTAPSAQRQNLPSQVSAELDAAGLIMEALKAAHASLPSRPAQQLDGGLLKRMLNLAHEAVISAKACVRHHDSGLDESHMGGQQQLQQPNEQPTEQSSQDVQSIIRGSAQRPRMAAPIPPAAAGAVLASEPAKGVWQMLGPGYWLIVASVNRGIRAAYTRALLSGGDSSSSSGSGRSGDGDCTWLCRTALSAVLQSDSVFRMALDIRAIPPAVHDMTFATLLSSSPRAQVAVGRAPALSCVMIQEAMDAQLTVDGTVLIGAAERCCESALDQWCLCFSYRPAWRAQRAWALPTMALSAIGETERPAALRVLRWVFNAASAEGSVVAGAAAGEVQLLPLLLTLLAFKCARYGHYDTFRWLYARGRALTAQDITPQVCVANFKAFMEQVMVPSHAAARGDKMLFLMKPEPVAPHTYSLMDNAICYGQEAFVRALSASDVPSLSSFTHDSAALAAANTSCRLLQWLHAHPACPFNAVNVIKASLQSCSGGTLGVSAGDDAIERIALEKLRWLHSVDAFEVCHSAA
eukprot:TRINITY_DN780_c0_g1_i5.p1 TRINITY_DN780_c0_g1~~TRINITY_DN780_c0_g1_i5.p1  ORF type:complete len:570 (+),score=142.67 TRINITY_DN780_c0_g1_i5:125-1834(+)